MAADVPPLSDPVALAAWAQQAWKLLGEDRDNALSAWKEARQEEGLSPEPVKVVEEGTVDSFSRRALRFRNLPPRIVEDQPKLPKIRSTRLQTTATQKRLQRDLCQPPPIPIGTEDVGGEWFRTLFRAAGATISTVAEVAKLSPKAAQWVVRGAMGPVVAERRLKMLLATRELAPKLYTPREWTFLESRTAPALVKIKCRHCANMVTVESSSARPVCEACCLARRPKRICLACGEVELPTLQFRFCPPCAKRRDADRRQAARIKAGHPPRQRPYRPYTPVRKKTEAERKAAATEWTREWRKRNPEKQRAIDLRRHGSNSAHNVKRRELTRMKREARNGQATG
jgi:hypothetical protein